MSNTENRFIDIEIKLAHQEHLVEALNQRIYEQQQQIDKLEQLCNLLVQHVRDQARNAGAAPLAHEPPPHY